MSLDAEAYLNSLEPFGWKLGLERMELLSDELGRPQDRFESIHVVGTNGKSSVARMTTAIINAHGYRSGCSLSPHLERWSERVVVEGEDIGEDDFVEAVEEVAAASGRVNSGLGEGEAVTQFEVATAAAFLALAKAGVDVAVIEAGLGGRLDATNSIRSKLTVLTSIGLDHTEWLGDTELEIAAEKLAVLRHGSKLILGGVSPEVESLAIETASRSEAELVKVPTGPPAARSMASRGAFQRSNFAIATTAAEAMIGELDPGALDKVAGSLVVHARLEQVDENPAVFIDVAHNRPGAAALASSLPEVSVGRPVFACLGVLAGKDGAGMIAELKTAVEHLVLTEIPGEVLSGRTRPGSTSYAAVDLEAEAKRLGLTCESRPYPLDAISRARELAGQQGGIVLVAGSHYLVAAMDL